MTIYSTIATSPLRRPYVRIPGDGNIYIGPMHGFPLGRGDVITTNTEISMAIGTVMPGWNYLYGYNDTGVAAFALIDGEAPDASLLYNSVNPNLVYLASTFATNTTVLRASYHANGRCVYRRSASVVGALQVLTAGTAASYTDVSLASHLPPHARIADVFVRNVNASGSQATTQLVTKGDSGNALSTCYQLRVDAGQEGASNFEIETDSSQKIRYQTSFGAVDIVVNGFAEFGA